VPVGTTVPPAAPLFQDWRRCRDECAGRWLRGPVDLCKMNFVAILGHVGQVGGACACGQHVQKVEH